MELIEFGVDPGAQAKAIDWPINAMTNPINVVNYQITATDDRIIQ